MGICAESSSVSIPQSIAIGAVRVTACTILPVSLDAVIQSPVCGPSFPLCYFNDSLFTSLIQGSPLFFLIHIFLLQQFCHWKKFLLRLYRFLAIFLSKPSNMYHQPYWWRKTVLVSAAPKCECSVSWTCSAFSQGSKCEMPDALEKTRPWFHLGMSIVLHEIHLH